jgi:hypothetical protein
MLTTSAKNAIIGIYTDTISAHKEGVLILSEGIKGFLDYLRDVETTYAAYVTAEVEANAETQDLLHFLELTAPDEATKIAVCNRIKEVRNERRRAKDYVTQAGPIITWIEANRPTIKSLEQLLGAVRKEERRGENRIFAPRTTIIDRLQEANHDCSDPEECV